jgi:hypothetical protein
MQKLRLPLNYALLELKGSGNTALSLAEDVCNNKGN